MKIEDFNPSGVGLRNNNFIWLPFTEENAHIVLFPVPWDVTVSYGAGTSSGPKNILNESVQLDLYDHEVPNAWKSGIYFKPINQDWLHKGIDLRHQSSKYIDFLEDGGDPGASSSMNKILNSVNQTTSELNDWVYTNTKKLLQDGKLIGLIGGDHSTPLGYYKALSEHNQNFGILHIDAHSDLRKAYEGFQFSHASIMRNALESKSITKLVQLGIRDYCDEEVQYIKENSKRIKVFYDHEIKNAQFNGSTFEYITQDIIKELPDEVYISLDIDALDPSLCPNTGTPVPGGLSFNEVVYIIKSVVATNRKIIGFDLVETAGTGHTWDGNVAARLVYKLCSWMAKSNNLI